MGALAGVDSHGVAASRTHAQRVRRFVLSAFSLICFALAFGRASADVVDYTYDDAGRLIQATDQANGLTTIYRFDAAGNVTDAVLRGYSLALPDQSPVDVTFRAETGDSLSLLFQEFGSNGGTPTPSSISAAMITVLKPDGAVLTTGTFTANPYSCGGSCSGNEGASLLNLGPLPIGGTYTVRVQQTASGTGSLSLKLSTPYTASLVADAPETAIALASGQSATLTFVGTAGQDRSIMLRELSSDTGDANASHITGAEILVKRPDGVILSAGTLATQSLECSSCHGFVGSVILNLDQLPVTGNYVLVVRQTVNPTLGTYQGTGTLHVTLSAPVD